MLLLTKVLSTPIISTVSTGPGVTRTAQNHSDNKNYHPNRMNAHYVLWCD